MKPRLLDLFCCEGGAAKGYADAGFEVVGVDIQPRPRYPYEFIQGDAMEMLSHVGSFVEYDAIHASPPCQAYSVAAASRRSAGHTYPDLLAATRELLVRANNATGIPWIIENVPGSPMRSDYVLCGSMFGLQIVRHRWFEVSWTPEFELLPACSHDMDAVTITGEGTPTNVRMQRIARGLYPNISVDMKRGIMEMPWASRTGLSQAIPPAYTKWIGDRLMASMKEKVA